MQALGSGTLQGELVFTRKIMHENAKNYQLWNHRRKCVLAVSLGLRGQFPIGAGWAMADLQCTAGATHAV